MIIHYNYSCKKVIQNRHQNEISKKKMKKIFLNRLIPECSDLRKIWLSKNKLECSPFI
jgi:hypothetical protein